MANLVVQGQSDGFSRIDQPILSIAPNWELSDAYVDDEELRVPDDAYAGISPELSDVYVDDEELCVPDDAYASISLELSDAYVDEEEIRGSDTVESSVNSAMNWIYTRCRGSLSVKLLP